MTRWEYAELSNPDSGTDAVAFSNPQRQTIVDDYKGWLQLGLKEKESSNQFLHVNLRHTNVIRICGLLGHDGWELVSHSTLTGGHEYFMFKRQIAEG